MTAAERNPAKRRATAREIYRMRRDAEGQHHNSEWLEQLSRFDWKCVYCGCQLTEETATRDHFIAIRNGGSDNIWNIVPACRPCNTKKGDRDPFSVFPQGSTTASTKLAEISRIGRVPDDPLYHLNRWRIPQRDVVVWSLRDLVAIKQFPAVDPTQTDRLQEQKVQLHRRQA